jgi:aminopeptidase-like protein
VLAALATQIHMTIHEYPTGEECFDWIIPEKWTCKEAYLESIDGECIFSYDNNPWHVVSYSNPYNGIVSRDKLLKHLYVHPTLSDVIPFVYDYYKRDWGLCCSQTLRSTLRDEQYRVVIRTDFSYGILKVGEVILQGKTEDSLVFIAKSCYVDQEKNDLDGIIKSIEVVRHLLNKEHHYTYHFLIVPDTIGLIAWLRQNQHFISKIQEGKFFELSSSISLTESASFFESFTKIDGCLENAIKDLGLNMQGISMIPMSAKL